MDRGRYILLVSRRKFCFAAPDSSPKSSSLFKNGDTPFEQTDVEDSIDGIWQTMAESARLFKYGSGVGSDWSTLRSSKETLLGGGTPGGPVSFTKA